MYLQVLQTREALVTGGTMMRLLIGVCADVDQHFIPVKHETWKRKMCLQDARKHTILCF